MTRRPLLHIVGLWVLVLLLTSPVQANGPIPFSKDFSGFNGAGFDPNPAAGQLDSDIWIVTGFSDGDVNFGDTQASGDFARGSSAGGSTTGGVYAFDTGGNMILGVQPTGTDFTPGEIILRLQNNTGTPLTQLTIAYDLWYLNDQERANSLNFSYSSDNVAYTPVSALDFTTPETSDALGWQSVPRSTTLTGLNIAGGDYFYLKWTGNDVSGAGSRDEYGLDNVQVTIATVDTPPTVSGTTPTDGSTNIAVNTAIDLNFSEAVTLTAPWFDLNCTLSGVHNATLTGGPQNYTLTPTTPFTPGETCTVTLLAIQITDQDGPADAMPADYVFSFDTVAVTSGWVINEILADPDAVLGDANGDGIAHTTQDEFVEIINNTGGPVDISGWILSDGVGIRHTFSPSTIVPDQCPVLIFAGGAPTGTFGSAVVQTASSGQLGLNNTGDTLTLNNGVTDLTTYTYGNEGGDNQSLTRDPDINGPNPLIQHTTATGAGGSPFSAGTRIDGTSFGVCSPPDTPPTVSTTTPANGETNVTTGTTISIVFNETVTITANAFTLECPTGAPLGFSVTPPAPGNGNTFTITPAANLPDNTICTVTVIAAQVTDQDGVFNNMASDYTFTFTTAVPAPPAPILISEFSYDGLVPSTEGDEFIELCNPNLAPVDLDGYKVGDEESNGGGESMYQFPAGTILTPNDCVVVAKNAIQFQTIFGFLPDFEVIINGSNYTDDPTVPNLNKYTVWGSGNWALANNGDELLVLAPNDTILDSVAYRNGDYANLGLTPDASAPEPDSLQRIWPIDTDSMPNDFLRNIPTPGTPTLPPSPPAITPSPAPLPNGMFAYWGDLHAHTSYSDGAGPPHYALSKARAAGLHFFSITDHGAWLSPEEWTDTLTQTIKATVPGQFVALRGVEWTHPDDGHINVFNTNTLLNRNDPAFDTLPEIYAWLAANPTAIAQFNHPGVNYDGDFDNFAFNPATTIHLQEIGNSAQGYVTYEPAFIQSNAVGWQTAPTNNSDTHAADWGTTSPARTGIVAPALTPIDLLDAMRARRVFATEDSNLALALRLNNNWMGSVLTSTGTMTLTVDFVDPDPESLTLMVYERNLLLHIVPFATSTGQWRTTVNALPGHHYWVKAVQADGDTAYSAPIWIEGQAPLETIVINEILPAPRNWDWDGDGKADYQDEWVELFNPFNHPVGLGGWQLTDSSNVTYNLPLSITIPAQGYVTLFHAQTGFSLNNDSDTVTLTHPNGTTVDTFTYTHAPDYDESWCRLPDGAAHWSDHCGPSPNAANWELPTDGPLKISIFEAKKLTPGAWVRIKGRVTAPPGILGSRTMYIQDDTAGILIYLPKDHGLFFNLGDKIEIEGYLKIYHEEFEVAVKKRGDIKFIEAGAPPPPLPIATTTMLEPYEGMLVMLQGQAVGFKGRSTMWIDDGTDWAKIYIRQSTGIKKPFIEIGTPVTAVGIVSQYSENDTATRQDYRLLPRYPNDLLIPTQPTNWPAILPETGY